MKYHPQARKPNCFGAGLVDAGRDQAYMERRTTEGLSKKDIIRCLKRLIVREIYYVLNADRAIPKRLTQAA
ncbi:MAG: hypothetical protein ACRDPB_05205 [Nocardioidaceae bacterium]